MLVLDHEVAGPGGCVPDGCVGHHAEMFGHLGTVPIGRPSSASSSSSLISSERVTAAPNTATLEEDF